MDPRNEDLLDEANEVIAELELTSDDWHREEAAVGLL